MEEQVTKGIRKLAMPRASMLVLPALGIFILSFLSVFVYLTIADGAWEEAGGMILLCLCLGVLILFCGFFGGYCMQKRHILYDEEQLLVGTPFHAYQRLTWRELSRMEIKNQDMFNLYDRDGVRRISASSDLEGYHDFYETAIRHLRPEYAVRNGDAGTYQREYSVTVGAGMLRYRTGEYVVMLVISLFLAVMIFVMGLVLGESINGMGAWLFSKEGIEPMLIVAGLVVISIVSLIYTSLQKITYDRRRITFERFPRGTENVEWNEVQRIGYSAEENNRSVTLYTSKKDYVIREKQFRKGFSEFVVELQRRADAERI